MKILLPVLLIWGCVYNVFAQAALVRGPYLQTGTPNSMTVRWNTDAPTYSILKFGTSPGVFTDSIAIVMPVTEHEIKASNLSPATKYYYTVFLGWDEPVSPGDTSFYFITSPVPGTEPPVHIWVIGDMGKNNAGQVATKEAYKQYRGHTHTDVWLWLGDNAYNSGTEQEFQEKVFNIYPEIFRNTVAWPTPGNHDYGSINQLTNEGPYFDLFTLPTNGEAGGLASGTEGYYSYDYGNIHFVSLNSDRYLWVLNPFSPMHTWLREDLAATDKKWKIVYWHQPPYTKGSHDSDIEPFFMIQMRNSINPICEEFGVDLVLSGHSHVYERSFLLKGHFGFSGSFDPAQHVIDGSSGRFSDGTPYIKSTTGDSANFGTVYCVVGNSGSIDSDAPLNHPAHFFGYRISHGSMVINVEGNRLDAQYLNSSNEILDEFTIIKDSLESPALGVEETEVNECMKVFPNPSENIVNVEVITRHPGEIRLELLNMEGKSCYTIMEGKSEKGTFSYQVPLQDIPAGNYYIRVKTADGIFQKPVVKM